MLSVKVFFGGSSSVFPNPWSILGKVLSITQCGISLMRANSLIQLRETRQPLHGVDWIVICSGFPFNISLSINGVCVPYFIKL